MQVRKNSHKSLILLVIFFLGSLVGCDRCKPGSNDGPAQNQSSGGSAQNPNNQPPAKTPTPITDDMITGAGNYDLFLQARLQELKNSDVTKIDLRDTNTVTALMRAAGFGNLNILNAFLSRGADVNMATRGGYTPLAWAVYNAEFRAAMALLQTGKMTVTALNLLNIRGGTVYRYASDQVTEDPTHAAEWTALVNALVKAGADTTL